MFFSSSVDEELKAIKRIRKAIDEALAEVKCGLCRQPFGTGIARVHPETTEFYGSWGIVHKSCVEQFEADMNG